jgi:hypothetical protein
MSYWSSMNLVRMGPPPRVTTSAMREFVLELSKMRVLEDENDFSWRIKFGERVDADELTTNLIDWNESGMIGTQREYPWDVNLAYKTIADFANSTEADNKPVYRALIGLGTSNDEIVNALTRNPCEDNEYPMCLWSLWFEVGPIQITSLGSESVIQAGWMNLSFSGPGYFFPWDFRFAKQRLESVDIVQGIVELCRKTWPVPKSSTSAKTIAARQECSELWMYDDFALSQDWLWFASEN